MAGFASIANLGLALGSTNVVPGHISKAITLAASGPDLPTIDDFLPPEILFQGTPFALNRLILVRIFAVIVIVLVLGITAKRAKLVPGRWQGAVEWAIDFVRTNIVYQVMGELRGKRYLPMISTIFFAVLIFNLCGVIPGLNIAGTATIVMPLVFALWTLVQYWAAGIREKGLGHFLKDELLPAGVPWPIYILLAPIMFLEILIVRPFSLTIRLFANMVAGHLLIAICFAATEWFLIESHTLLSFAGVATLLGGFIMTLFELMVAALQAFIFAILTTSYINMSYPEMD
jgi:F-type H+-transporting ATPase subunit a